MSAPAQQHSATPLRLLRDIALISRELVVAAEGFEPPTKGL